MFTDISAAHFVKQITSFSVGFCVIIPAKKICVRTRLLRDGLGGAKTVK